MQTQTQNQLTAKIKADCGAQLQERQNIITRLTEETEGHTKLKEYWRDSGYQTIKLATSKTLKVRWQQN